MLPALALLLLFIFIIVQIYGMLKAIWSGRKAEKEFHQILYTDAANLLKKSDVILNLNLIFYKNLSRSGKQKFLDRLKQVLVHKKIHGKNGLKLTDEMRILCAAAFVQVTFGLEKYILPRFGTIWLYPERFHHRLLNKAVFGTTSHSGIIRFSWQKLKEGFEAPDDKINLAIHEIAHAIKITVDGEEEIDDSLFDYLSGFFERHKPLREKIANDKTGGWKNRGGVNEHEFFAICLEYFFECPEELSKNHPQLYRHLCFLLNLDPLNQSNDFSFIPSAREEFGTDESTEFVKLKKNFSYQSWHWSLTIWLFGIFAGIPYCYATLSGLDLTRADMFLLGILISIIGAIIFWRHLVSTGYMPLLLFCLFLLFGFLPLATSGLVGINFLVPVSSEVESYEIVGFEHKEMKAFARLKDNFYDWFLDARKIDTSDPDLALPKTRERFLNIYFVRGTLGLRYVDFTDIDSRAASP